MNVISVILADDSLSHRTLMGDALTDGGRQIKVLSVGDLVAFEDAIRQEKFDCAILDYCLQDCTGADLAKSLKSVDPDCPIIFVTNSSDPEVAVSCLRAGAADMVIKYNVLIDDELFKRVRKVVADRRRATRARRHNQRRFNTLRHLANQDPLTGLKNRRAIRDAVRGDRRSGVDRREVPPVIMIDLDHFKRINDTYGHPFGDTVLRSVARFLREHTDSPYDLCRWGGEEFLIVCHGANAPVAFRLAERLRTGIAAMAITPAPNSTIGRTQSGPGVLHMTVSIGVASADIPRNRDYDLTEQIERADQALYVAKNMGRNRTITWEVARLNLLCAGKQSPSQSEEPIAKRLPREPARSATLPQLS